MRTIVMARSTAISSLRPVPTLRLKTRLIEKPAQPLLGGAVVLWVSTTQCNHFPYLPDAYPEKPRIMAKPRRQTKTKQDAVITAKDLFSERGSNMWPQTREELIQRQRPSKAGHVLAMAVCGIPPEGEEPHGVTDEWIWRVEEITPTTPGCEPYRRISCAQICNPKPGFWITSWKGAEGLSTVPLLCPPEFFKLVPVFNPLWRADVEANPDRTPPTFIDMGQTGIMVEGGAA